MLIFIGILYVIYQVIKAAADDAQMKEWSKKNGLDYYSSRTGLKDVKTGKHCYINPMTGEKKLW